MGCVRQSCAHIEKQTTPHYRYFHDMEYDTKRDGKKQPQRVTGDEMNGVDKHGVILILQTKNTK